MLCTDIVKYLLVDIIYMTFLDCQCFTLPRAHMTGTFRVPTGPEQS